MTDRLEGTWHTSDEIAYLNNIGTHSRPSSAPSQRLELLRNYHACLDKRPRSEGFLDFAKLRRHVERLIAAEGGV